MEEGNRRMSYFQCFLLIATIWAAELVSDAIFDLGIPASTRFQYRTYYLDAGTDGRFYGADLQAEGKQGWEVIEIVPGDDGRMVCFMKKRKLF